MIAPFALVVEVPLAIVIAPMSAVTSIVPALPVAMLESWVTASPVMVMTPVVELTTALRSTVPASAFSVTAPEPSAVTTELTVRSPVSTSILTCPLPSKVRTPVPAMTSPSVSWIKMFPETVFVATSVPIVVSMSASPPADPIPVAADRVAVPVVTRLANSANKVLSVIAPPAKASESAVTFNAPLVEVNKLSATSSVAL